MSVVPANHGQLTTMSLASEYLLQANMIGLVSFGNGTSDTNSFGSARRKLGTKNTRDSCDPPHNLYECFSPDRLWSTLISPLPIKLLMRVDVEGSTQPGLLETPSLFPIFISWNPTSDTRYKQIEHT